MGRKNGYHFALILFGIVFLSVARAQNQPQGPSVRVEVRPEAIEPDGYLDYSVIAQVAGDDNVGQPTLGKNPDFEVLSSSSSSSMRSVMVSTNKGPKFTTTRTLTHSYRMRPKREGVLRIRPTEVIINGKPFLTEEKTVQVAKGAGGTAPQRPQPPLAQDEDESFPPPMPALPQGSEDEDDLFSQLLRRHLGGGQGGSKTFPLNPKDAFFIQVETDKTEAYVGEQITVSWYLYTRGSIREIDTLKYPSLRGFWKEDIEMATSLNFVQEVVNGIGYKKALLASYAIFPLKEGTSVIDSYTAKCSVVSADDIMGQLGVGKAYSYTKSSQPIKVAVKPVPVEGRPADFTGGVGDFQVSARIDDRNLVQNQPFTLSLRFDGRGNSKMIDIPNIEIPEGFEKYNLQNEAKFFKTGTSYKEFRQVLIPRKSGSFVIPAISVSLFDPGQKKFYAKKTDLIPITVQPGQPGSIPQNPVAANPLEVGSSPSAKPPVGVEPEIISEFRSRGVWTQAQQTGAFSVLLVSIFFTLLWRAREELGWGEKKRTLQTMLQSRLKRAREALGRKDFRTTGTEIANAISFVLGQAAGEHGANSTFNEMLQRAPPSVRRELSEPLRRLHERSQALSFAPQGAVESMFSENDIKTLLQEAEKYLVKAVALAASSEPEAES